MKILRLRINNLASLAGEQAEINFEQAPLANSSLIAIVGRTGAGKSTILDAICLALFNEIPRLQSVGRNTKVQDSSGELLTLESPLNILRRGCVSGYAELDFVGLDQKAYTARWSVTRAHKKINGKIKLERNLISIEDKKLLAHKKTDFEHQIHQLIGMDFKQFTRAVLLAQSEVVAFLKANDEERANVLEYLTNSEIYAEIGKTAHLKHKSYTDQLNSLKQALGFIELLSDEEMNILKQQKNDIEQQLKDNQLQHEQYKQQQAWYIQLNNLSTQLQQAEYTLQQQQNQQAEMDQLRLQIQRLQQVQQIQPTLQQISSTNQQLEKSQQQQAQLQQAIQHSQTQAEHQQQLFTQASEQFNLFKQKQQQLQPIFQQAIKLDVSLENMRQEYKNIQNQHKLQKEKFDTVLQQHQQYNTDLQQKQQKKSDYQQQLQKFIYLKELLNEPKSSLIQVNQLKQAYQHYQDLIHELNHHLSQVNVHQLQQQLTEKIYQMGLDLNITSDTILDNHNQDILKDIQSLNTQIFEKINIQKNDLEYIEQSFVQQESMIKTLQQAEQKLKTLQDMQALISAYQQQYHDDLKLKQTAESEYQSARQEFASIQKVLAQQKLLCTDYVVQLREQLQPNEACPVCGSQNHPFIEHEQLINDALQQLESQQLQQAEQQQNLALEKLEQAKYQYVASETKLQQQQQQLQLAETDWQDFSHDILVNFKAETDDLKQKLIIFIENKNLAEIQSLLVHYQQDLQNTVNHKKQLQSQLNQYAVYQQQLQQMQNDYQHYQNIILAEQDYQKLYQHILSQLENHDLQQMNIHDFCKKITQDIQVHSNIQQQLLTIEKHIHDLQTQCNQLQFEQQHLQAHVQQQQQQLDQMTQSGQQQRQQLTELMQNYPTAQVFSQASAWQQQFDQDYQDVEGKYQSAQNSLQNAQQQLHKQHTEQQLMDENLSHLQQQIQKLQQVKQQWLAKHNDFDDALLQQMLALSEQHPIEQLQQTLSDYQQKIISLTAQCDTLKQQLQQHQALQHVEPLALAEIEQQLQALQAQQQHLQQQLQQYQAQLLQQEQAVQKQQQQQKQIELLQQEQQRWYKIHSLIGSSDGKIFRAYAQQYYLDMLLQYANLQLEPLAPRYQLERIENSLSLAVIDHDMNGEKRAVASLSGGESFIVALALALALANFASGSLKLESLFIDEGFGTLDPNSLHLVMDALDKLQSQGRKVVVISHIEAMHERIPVQIQVNSIGAGESKIEIVG
ncbi:AAA family ATPase [Acinetobacter sp. c3-l95]|uniref:AAA family ATPase n=1 Tax=Acinetobacter sp. c3-l95 TaxID=3342804 RepID=UPI0035B9A83A